MAKLFSPVLETEIAEEKNLRDNRMVRVTLLESSTREAIELRWNVGGSRGRDTVQSLKRGQHATLPVGRAQSYFGHFTIPHDLEDIVDEGERSRLIKMYFDMRSYALRQWGDYPMAPGASSPGLKATGPHRFPDVSVVVIEQSGDEWPPLRLHELYEIGEFDGQVFAPVVSAADLETEAQRQAREIAELKGQIAMLVAMQTANAAKPESRPAARANG